MSFATELRHLAAEFNADRDYGTADQREAFRVQLTAAIRLAASYVEDEERARLMPLPSDELDQFGFDVRILNALRNSRLVTVAQIAAAKDHQLLRIPNLGALSLKRVRSVIPAADPISPVAKTLAETVAADG